MQERLPKPKWAKTFLLSPNVRHQVRSAAAVKYERALGSHLGSMLRRVCSIAKTLAPLVWIL